MFKIGMKVKCIAPDGDWWDRDGNLSAGPCTNEITVISGFDSYGLHFKEYPNSPEGFQPAWFIPLDETFADSVLASIAEQIEEEQVVEI